MNLTEHELKFRFQSILFTKPNLIYEIMIYQKILAIITILVLFVNIILFGLGLISTLTFWLTIIVGAIIGYSIPNLKK